MATSLRCPRCGKDAGSPAARGTTLCPHCGTVLVVDPEAATVALPRPGDAGTGRAASQQVEGQALPSPGMSDPLVGRQVASCQVLERLGEGGMGVVYKAYHPGLNKTVALKVLRPQCAGGDYVERFLKEAQAAAKLEHPNVVQVLHAGREGDLYFLLMQYVDGESLGRRLAREGRLECGEALRIAEDSARALSAAHELGLIHRDIKPDNIMLTRKGVVKVADFGLAKDLAAHARLTLDGTAVGSPAYMSPEQCMGLPVDHRTDLYSLGVTLYETLAGDLPFHAAQTLALFEKHKSEPPPPLAGRVPGLPEPVGQLVMRLLEKDPDARYPSALDLVRDLEAIRRGEPVQISPPGPGERPRSSAVLKEGHKQFDMLVREAHEAGATDVHVEPLASGWRVRFRVEGAMQAVRQMAKAEGEALVRALLAAAKLKHTFAEPQEGRLDFECGEVRLQVRFSTLPSKHGPRLALRLTSPFRSLPLDNLPLLPEHRERARKWAATAAGVLLFAGPTGSGKSTVLLSFFSATVSEKCNALAITDEDWNLEMENLSVIPVTAEFPRHKAIQSLERQDSDVVMVDDLPDRETADLFFRFALTGHLCLTACHGEDAADALVSFLELGVKRSQLSSALKLIWAQRLARRNCRKCREEYQPQAEVLDRFAVPPELRNRPFFKGRGCEACRGSGYSGRTILYEFFENSPAFWAELEERRLASEIRPLLRKHGLFPMRKVALQRILDGDLNFTEALAILPSWELDRP